jgi:hypothetical protein
VIAFDKSGSMEDRVDGVPRIEFARDAVRRVFETVPAADTIGIIAFDSAPHVVAPLKVGHDLTVLANDLGSVRPSGATAIAPAMALADSWLHELPGNVRRRHLLLVSDGRTSASDAARVRAIAERRQMEISVVALGTEADRSLLEDIARISGGRAYFPNDIRDLPAVVARESSRVAGGQLVDTAFRPIVRAHPLVADVAGAAIPMLGGYVVTALKPRAEAPLQSPLGDPVLATWRFGLGRVVAYTADLHSPWSAALVSWNGAARLFSGIARAMSPTPRDRTLYATLREKSGGIQLIVEAHDGEAPLSELRGDVAMRTPSGDTMTMDLQETSPGRYEATLPAPEAGAYTMAISAARVDGRLAAHLVRGIYWSGTQEHRDGATNMALLKQIAELSGGRVLRDGDRPFAIPRQPTSVDIAPALTVFALLAFLAEVLWPSLSAGFSRVARRAAFASDGEAAA